MNIYFKDEGRTTTANMTYNFREVEDCVLISFADRVNQDIFFSKTAEEWHSVSAWQICAHQTYLNIQGAITDYFKREQAYNAFYL